MTTTQTRFVNSTLAIVALTFLAALAIIKGDAVTAPLCIPAIGAIAGYYTYGKTKNNDTLIQNQNKQTP